MTDDSKIINYPLSVILITHNEERNITECLQSVAWADDIVVVDAKSEDRTIEYAKKYTTKIFITDWLGYAAAKNFALSKATNCWVLWIDADERIPEDLASEIQTIISAQSVNHAGYEVGRRAYFLGRWIKHCGWYPGYVVRLFMKDCSQFNDALVHEKLDVKGSIGRLRGDIIHYTDDNLFHYFSKFNHYTSLAAEDLHKNGRRYSLADLLIHPPFLFFKMYILRIGFLDGIQGFILSVLSSAYVFTKYAKLWELQRKK
ncbi:MAG: glycosyltransferase family 2 protein [Bacteroidota bacterium]